MSIARIAVLSALICCGFVAGAQTAIQGLRWRVQGDGRFTLTVAQNGVGTDIKGVLQKAKRVEVKQTPFTAALRAYDGFVTVSLIEDGIDEAQIFLFEQRDANFAILNHRPIRVLASGVNVDLDDAITAANKSMGLKPNTSDPSLAFRRMVEYFNEHPDKLLSDFTLDAELVRLVAVPKPITKLDNQGHLPSQVDSAGNINEQISGDPLTTDWVPREVPQGRRRGPRNYQQQQPSDSEFFSPPGQPDQIDEFPFAPRPRENNRNRRSNGAPNWPPPQEPSGLW